MVHSSAQAGALQLKVCTCRVLLLMFCTAARMDSMVVSFFISVSFGSTVGGVTKLMESVTALPVSVLVVCVQENMNVAMNRYINFIGAMVCFSLLYDGNFNSHAR